MATISSEETEKLNYVVFFDVDKTLIKAISGREIARHKMLGASIVILSSALLQVYCEMADHLGIE
jgi:phosphoserine phosphatase